jgi:hypothetical protein
LPKYKDNDFLNDGKQIKVGPEERERLMKTIQSDAEVMTAPAGKIDTALFYEELLFQFTDFSTGNCFMYY